MRKVRYPVAKLEELPSDQAKVVPLGPDGFCALIRRREKVFALGSLCPHQNTSLDGAPVQENLLICRRHGYRFDLTTGECLTLGGYALPTFPTEIEAGIVYVTVWDFD